MKRIVLFYSKTGSNKYLAQRIAGEFGCDIEEIKPVFNSLLSIIFSSLFKMKILLKKFINDISKYDEIILCGPIWMGTIVSPLLTIIKKYNSHYNKLTFITCCGSSDESKNDKFGYNLVFNSVKELIGNKSNGCFAIPIGLAVPEDKKDDDQEIMNTRLNDSNFNDEISDRFNTITSSIKQ